LPEHERSVACDLHAGADFPDLVRLLENGGLDAVTPKRDRSGQAGNSGARDQNMNGRLSSFVLSNFT
jgi:hypothetical protein